jgi:hypothetical protein
VHGKETGLLGIRSKAARDGEEEPRVVTRRGRQAVEGERDIGPHRLPDALFVRPDLSWR